MDGGMRRQIFAIGLWSGFSSIFAGTMGQGVMPYDFSGYYGGLGTGFSTFFDSDKHSTVLTSAPTATTAKSKSTQSAILFDGHLGYGRFIQQNTYLGAKGSVYYTPLESLAHSTKMIAGGDTLTSINNINYTTIKPVYNIDAIFGYEVYPHLLPFVEAGVSFANVSAKDTQKNIRTNLTTSTSYGYSALLTPSGYKTGYNVGLGTNYQLSKNWFLSSELIYNYLGKHTATDTVNVPVSVGTQTDTTNRTYQLVSLLASVSYLFPDS